MVAGPSGKRARRIPAIAKRAVAIDCTGDNGISRPSNFAASWQALKKRRDDTGAAVSITGSKNFVKDSMLQYNWLH